ncbi:hypothetical protein [Micromonospora sp. NPDC005087]|uniref:hypothetical protein n=1 Tax=Micromonospora sp. NPDC005087 TaxID=3364225 RepID=UPI0036B0AD89
MTRRDEGGRVEPVAIEALLLAAEQDLHRAREQARQLIELHREHMVGPTKNVVELVSGDDSIRLRIAQLQKAARRELRVMRNPGEWRQPAGSDTQRDLLARDVTCRTIYDRAAVELPGALTEIEQLATAGAVGRVLPNVALEMHIADDRLALLPLHSAPPIKSALVIHSSGLLDALGHLYECLWQRALPLGLNSQPPRSHTRFDESERRRISALLLSGLTDQAIGRQLGLSYRTAQRRIAKLLEELNASTRFQAGVQAAIRDREG